MDTSWSLHLLSELLSAFSTEDPENLRQVLNRVAEAVDAEVAAIITGGQLEGCIGLAESERQQLPAVMGQEPSELSIRAGRLQTFWAPLDKEDRLLVGRLQVPFDLEERSLLRAMARSIELSLSLLRAISAERQARLDAFHQASHDALTGLPNRTMVVMHLAGLLGEGKAPDFPLSSLPSPSAERFLASEVLDQPPVDAMARSGGEAIGKVAVLFIDIDRFKWLNDAHGHAAGDALLVAVSRILRRSVRHRDLVGRLSGDEFIVITRDGGAGAGTELAERIIAAIAQPIQIAGIEVIHSASVGISVASPGDTPSSLIENADMAMYEAKAQGRGHRAVFEPRMRLRAQERLVMEEALRQAVASGAIEAHLQPVHRLADGTLIGFEALARWRHPEQGLLLPTTFIPAAEESGLIEAIDLAVLAEACQAVARWQQQGGREHLRISSNVAARTLGAVDLVEQIEPILRSSGIRPEQVYLEITETSLVAEIHSTTTTIERLRQLGVKLAIDDFGTGYSSLLYLKRFPVGLLKIDRSFVADLGRDPEDEAIARAILSLAGALGVEVVAEGIETSIQLDWLRNLHCAYGQGYLFGRPEPIAIVERRLAGCIKGGMAAV
ncbi:MAG: putative bifunctional diguanylate cyclase/phosphodiesterase [Cyanobium sp.]